MIYFLLEKVLRCAQMPVDCFRASKLVTLGYHKGIKTIFTRQVKCITYIHACSPVSCPNIFYNSDVMPSIKIKHL